MTDYKKMLEKEMTEITDLSDEFIYRYLTIAERCGTDDIRNGIINALYLYAGILTMAYDKTGDSTQAVDSATKITKQYVKSITSLEV